MIYILEEDLPKFNTEISRVMNGLSVLGFKRIESDVKIGTDNIVAHLTGYWIGDLMRIDIKFGDK